MNSHQKDFLNVKDAPSSYVYVENNFCLVYLLETVCCLNGNSSRNQLAALFCTRVVR